MNRGSEVLAEVVAIRVGASMRPRFMNRGSETAMFPIACIIGLQ